jgi:hypothetical protein
MVLTEGWCFSGIGNQQAFAWMDGVDDVEGWWWSCMVYLNKEFYQLASSPEMCKKNVALPFVNRNNVARSPAMWHGHEWCSKVIYLPNRAPSYIY